MAKGNKVKGKRKTAARRLRLERAIRSGETGGKMKKTYETKENPGKNGRERCPWCLSDPVYIDYHDREWGVPVHDDRKLFEFLVLEGAQAGLNWLMILKKRENYRRAYDGFDYEKVSRYGERRIARLLADPGLVRNRAKIRASVANARAFVRVREECGSFDRYIWGFVNNKPIHNRWKRDGDIPPRTPLSDAISADLRRRGFKFVGSTIIYSHMQATGMVNDHLAECFRHDELSKPPAV